MEQTEQSIHAAALVGLRQNLIEILYSRFVSRAVMVDTGIPMTEEEFRRSVDKWSLIDLLKQIDTDIRLEQEKMKVQAELTKPFQQMVEADARLSAYLHREFFPQHPALQPAATLAVEDLAIDAMRRISEHLKPKTFKQKIRFLFFE